MSLHIPRSLQRHARVIVATTFAVVIAASSMLAQFGTFQPSFDGELWGTRHELTLDNEGAPSGVAFSNGMLFVADAANQTIVAYDNAGDVVAIPGAEWDATVLLSPISGFVPYQLAAVTVNVDGSDRAALLVSDQSSNRVAAFDLAGEHLFTLRLTRPATPPEGLVALKVNINQIAMAHGAKFTLTTGLIPTLSTSGTFAAAWMEQWMNGVQKSGVLAYPSTTSYVPLLGEFHVAAAQVLSGTESDPVAPEPINTFGVAFDKLGNIYTLDMFTERLNVYGPALNHLFTFGTPVPDLTTAEFHEPWGMVFWPDATGTGGRLLVADTYKNRILVYRAVDGIDADSIVDALQLETTISNFTLDLDNLAGFSLAVDPVQNLLATADHSSQVLVLSTFRLTAFNLQVLNDNDEVVDSVCTAADYKVRFSLTVPAGFADVEGVAPTLMVNGVPTGAVAQPFAVYPSATLSAGDVVTYTYSLTAPGTTGADIELVAGANATNTSDIASRAYTLPLSDCAGETDPSTISATPMRAAQVSGWTPVFTGETFTVTLQAQDDDGISSIAYMLEGANESGEEPIETEFDGDPTDATLELELPETGRSTLRFRVRDANGIWSTWQTRDYRTKLVVNRETNENSEAEFRVGDPEGVGFTYSVNRVPDGFTFSTETGQFAGVASYSAKDPYSADTEVAAGVYNIVVTETASGGATSEVSFIWTINHVNRPPSITSVINGFSVGLANPFSLQITGFDPDGDPSIWTLNGKGVNTLQDIPQTVTIDPSTGLISGVFPPGSDTEYTLSVGLAECAVSGTTEPCTGLVLDHEHFATLLEINVGVLNLNQRADVVNPGPQVSAEGDSPTLQIAASDPENDTLRFEVGGLPDGLTIDADTGEISGTVGYDTAGIYSVTVEVFDNVNVLPRAVTFFWTITNTNRPPVVTPPNRQNNEGETVAVTNAAYASDPDGDAVTFVSATGLPAGLTMNAAGAISGTLGYNTAGSYPVTVVVTDGTLQGTGSFTWTILNFNRHPVLTVADQFSAEGDTVSLQIEGSDPDGDDLIYSMNGLPAGFSIDPQTGIITGTFSLTSAGVYTVTVAVSDGELAVTKTFIWTVTEGNRPPVITAIPDRTDTENDTITLAVIASDPDGVPGMTYSATGLPPGVAINPLTGVITGTLTYESAGVYPIVITVTDASGTGGTSTTSFTWTVNPLNRPPVVSLPDRQNNEGESVNVSLAGYASDPDGDTVSIVSATGLPPGLTMDANGLVTGTLGYGTAGTYTVTFVVSDGAAQATTTFVWTINDVNRPPVLTVADQLSYEGDTVSLRIVGSDPDGDELVFSMNGLPPGFTIDPATGIITGTFDSNSAGVYSVNIGLVEVGPNATGGVRESFTWTVREANRPPVVTHPDRANVEGDTVSYPTTASDPDGDVLTYSVTGLPAGISINPANGLLTGTLGYASAGTYTPTITVTDGRLSASHTFTWVVTNTNRPPTAVNDSATVTQGQSVTIAVLPNDFDLDGDALSIVSFTQAANGAVTQVGNTFVYTPLASFSGVDAFTYTITDGTAISIATVTITVVPCVDPATLVGGIARRVQPLNGRTEGNIQVLTATDVTFNSGAVVTGDLRIVGTPQMTINGTPTFGGTFAGAGAATPTSHRIILNGGSTLGRLVTATDAVTMPVVNAPPASAGTRYVTMNTAADNPAPFATLRSLTLNSNVGLVAVPEGTYDSFIANTNTGFILGVSGATTPSVYNFQSLTLNSGSQLQVVGPVIITVRNSVSLSGDMGNVAHPEWLTLRVSNGDLTLNADRRLYGYVEAPNGNLTVNGGSVLVGGFAVNQYTSNSNGLVVLRPLSGGCAVNTPPVVPTPDNLTDYEGETISQQFDATDADGDELTFSATGLPPGLTMSASGLVTGTLSYTAAGVYTVTMTVTDGTTPRTVTFLWTIIDVNRPPVVTHLDRTNVEGDSVAYATSASDPDGDALSFTVVGLPAGISINSADGTLTGNLDYASAGTYTPTITVSDGALTASHTFTWVVTSVNRPPDAVNDVAAVNQGQSVNISVLNLDSDPDNDALTVTSITQPATGQGTAVLNNDGTVTYTAPASFAGTTTFTYTISDGNGGTDTATVTITVSNVNFPPTVFHANRTNAEGDAVVYSTSALDPDGDALTFMAVGLPAGISINPSNGTLTGTLGYASAGTYSPTITVSDGLLVASHTFTWVVTEVNRPPDAVNDSATTNQGQAATIAVLNLDSDPDTDPLSVTGITQPASGQGTAVLNANGTVTYTPPANFVGTATFTYTISDGKGGSDTATVTVTVSAVSCTPTGYTTYSQGGWGNNGAPGQLMAANFGRVYTSGFVIIGGNYTLKFTSATAIKNFLPQGGTPAMLNGSAVNPTSSGAGNLAAQVLALRLAVDYSAAGVLKAGLGNLVMISGPFANRTVNQILATANAVLGGSSSALPSGVTLSQLNSVVESLNLNFHEGTVNNGLLGCASGQTQPPANRAPVAVNDSATTKKNKAVSVNVLANDSDPDGDVLTVALGTATKGTITLNADKTIKFTPQSNYKGAASFTYTISDGKGGTATATVSVNVTN